MMLERQKERIENNTSCYEQLKQWVLHDSIQAVLELKPSIVIYTAIDAALTISVQQFIYDQIRTQLLKY